jgi:hypothetical protein
MRSIKDFNCFKKNSLSHGRLCNRENGVVLERYYEVVIISYDLPDANP